MAVRFLVVLSPTKNMVWSRCGLEIGDASRDPV